MPHSNIQALPINLVHNQVHCIETFLKKKKITISIPTKFNRILISNSKNRNSTVRQDCFMLIEEPNYV